MSQASGHEGVDPQFLWILPEQFEVTELAKDLVERGVSFRINAPLHLLYRIEHLLGLGTRYIAHFTDDQAYRRYGVAWRAFCKEEYGSEQKIRFSDYHRHKVIQEDLNLIGLDMHGGLLSRVEKGDSLDMTDILVLDPQKASKFFNIGIKLPSENPEYPKSLCEAATMFADLSRLIKPKMTMKEYEAAIEECKDSNEKWELERKKFRLKILDRYRKALIELAIEEQLSGMKGNKRAGLWDD
ncbi:hypothetical protein BU24DRAFT_459449 [Aaosphaeria arxii CBS 175.79]|uniref:Uncharacterized protein n=1 Tax=Aaosphaeria arxii CBS 175.79 TaxID=1450172 RepID=A0A6A5Y4U9_9PLEO|nr:uncharacterized protein BU24DRAFT_459449 [Aaosphaeria arxii CBS 175.79]KAF2019820.1 hypothetical protein BU24DRAFT_459449 [Aaosphaeria arxii CBS 175.79]